MFDKSKRFSFAIFLLLFLVTATSVCAKENCCFSGHTIHGNPVDDLAVYYPDTGNWYIRSMAGKIVAFPKGWGFDQVLPVPGDYDKDGRTDLAVYHRESGKWYILSLGANAVLANGHNWGWNDALPVPGDYDGDGRADLAVYYRDNGSWFVSTLSGTALPGARGVGDRESTPVPGDYDGDGRDDFAVYHRATGKWRIMSSTGTLLANNLSWGWKDAWPVPGDYDGDGRADLAVYHRESGRWYIITMSGIVLAAGLPWGWKGATPVPGDYDGDKRTDLALYDRSSGKWYILRLNKSLIAFGVAWGFKGAVPAQVYANACVDGMIVLAFGDSITYGGGSSADGPATGYPMLLEKKLMNTYGGWFTFINDGKGGECTWNGRNRLVSDLSTMNPDALLLMEGTNDALYDYMYRATGKNLGFMATYCTNRGMRVVMATIPPVFTTAARNREAQHNRIRNFNPTLRSNAAALGLPIAEIYAAITSHANWSRDLMEQVWGNHPNDAGYRVIRDTFYSIISSRLYDGSWY